MTSFVFNGSYSIHLNDNTQQINESLLHPLTTKLQALPYPKQLKHSRRLGWAGLCWIKMLMSMAATEGEFLLISGKSHHLCSSSSQYRKGWYKSPQGEKHCSKYKRKHERLSLSWQWDRKNIKKKGIAREYETRKDRQHSESQFVCSLVGWHWLRPAFLP